MNSLFSKHSCRPESDAVLSAFLTIFSTYIKRMRKTKEGEDLYSWVNVVSGYSSSRSSFTLNHVHIVQHFCYFLVRVPGSGVSAMDHRRDCYNAHPCSPCHGDPIDFRATQRYFKIKLIFVTDSTQTLTLFSLLLFY